MSRTLLKWGVVVPLRAVRIRNRQEVLQDFPRKRNHLMKNVDGTAARLVDETDAALAGVPAELAVTLTDTGQRAARA